MSDIKREEKLRALDAAIAQIEKQYGQGSVMKLGDSTTQKPFTIFDATSCKSLQGRATAL